MSEDSDASLIDYDLDELRVEPDINYEEFEAEGMTQEQIEYIPPTHLVNSRVCQLSHLSILIGLYNHAKYGDSILDLLRDTFEEQEFIESPTFKLEQEKK